MRKKEEFDATDNRGVYNKIHKELHANCSYCGWNRGCNARHKHRITRNWKRRRKTQWKDK